MLVFQSFFFLNTEAFSTDQLLRRPSGLKSSPVCISKTKNWDFPGGPGAKTLHSQCRGPGFNPWSGKLHPTRCNEDRRSCVLQLRPDADKQINIKRPKLKTKLIFKLKNSKLPTFCPPVSCLCKIQDQLQEFQVSISQIARREICSEVCYCVWPFHPECA